MHEFVDKIWFVEVASQRAELFVGGKVATERERERESVCSIKINSVQT